MRIGILTLHRANNYGAVLQCYALQDALLSLGHEVRVIDYRQPDTELSYKPLRWEIIRRELSNPMYLGRELLLRAPLSFIRKIAFNRFRKTYLKCTPPFWKIADMPQDFELYLIGSDQLWSIQCIGGNIEEVFFGKFPHPEKSRIAGYAISSNIPSLQTIGLEKLKQYLVNFDSLSVRESGINEWLKEKIGVNARIDVDPTMLFDASKWEAITSKRPTKSKYVLTYFLLPEQKIFAKQFAQKHGLKLIEVGKVAFSPQQFLAYVKHAEYILGGSFHIAVFSVMFQKCFFIIKKDSCFDIRSFQLLNSLGLQDHFINVEKLSQIEVDRPIDFDVAKLALTKLREESLNYLHSL